MTESFLSPAEQALGERFLKEGCIAMPVDDRGSLDRIQRRTAELAAEFLRLPAPADPQSFLDRVHERVTVGDLNALRLHVIAGLNAEPWLRPAYFRLARSSIEAIVSNELCMQRRVNLSIQLPKDDSSLLATHADVWSGDSPFEVVVWLPLVDVYRTKSMYLLPPAPNERLSATMTSYASAEALYQAIKTELTWIDMRYGEVLLFNQALMHGNRVNEEETSRWTMNCRFKSVFSPYADKRLGEFFEPIVLRPATRVGMAYKRPGGFDG